MQTVSLELEVPSELLTLLRKSRRETEQDAQLWVMLELFRHRKVSAGKAAELTGMRLGEFMDFAREHRVEWASYTDEELETELHEAVALGKAVRGER